jgi:hypothetical protein
MRYLIVLLLVGLAFQALAVADPPRDVSAEAGQETTDETMSVWMKKKLDYSQALLAALAMGDFEAIKTNGNQMKLLNRVEGFVRRRNPTYKKQIRMFEESCQAIVDSAAEQDLSGATLAFNQLTVNCVQCHRTLRQQPQ